MLFNRKIFRTRNWSRFYSFSLLSNLIQKCHLRYLYAFVFLLLIHWRKEPTINKFLKFQVKQTYTAGRNIWHQEWAVYWVDTMLCSTPREVEDTVRKKLTRIREQCCNLCWSDCGCVENSDLWSENSVKYCSLWSVSVPLFSVLVSVFLKQSKVIGDRVECGDF